jgi:geranylgeranyl pyrophosphate synthase
MKSEIEKILSEYKPLIDKAIEKNIPREFRGAPLERMAGKPRYAYDSQSITQAISKPIWDLLDRGGKRWRPALTLLVMEALGKNPREYLDFAVISEVVHNGCVTENSVIWMADGTPKTILEIKIGDAVISLEENFSLKAKAVRGIHDNGVKSIYRIRTAHREIEATEEHPFLVAGKRQPVKVKLNAQGVEAVKTCLKNSGSSISLFAEKYDFYTGVSKGHLKNWLYGCKSCLLSVPEAINALISIGVSDDEVYLEAVKCDFSKALIDFEWKKAKDLKAEDLVVVSKNVYSNSGVLPSLTLIKQNHKDRFVLPQSFSLELAQLCGFLVGDGCIDDGRVALCIPRGIAGRRSYEELVEKIFGAKPTLMEETITICSKAVSYLFTVLGLRGKCTTKTLPEWVFKLPLEYRKAFVKGYIDADGTVSKSGLVHFDAANKKLIMQFKFLLDSMGFVTSNIHERRVDNTHFKKPVSKNSTLLYGFSLAGRERVLSEIGTESEVSAGRLSMKMVRQLSFRFSEEIPSIPINFDLDALGFDKITEVVLAGEKHTYDLQIEGTHNYLANGLVVHNTLMVDDIEDDSDFRRGKPCIHKIYGNDIAINAGNAMYFLPLKIIMQSSLPDKTKNALYEVYAQEMINVSLGQGMDIYWHKGLKQDVSEKEYLQMCAYKTGCLARMAAKIGAVIGGATPKQLNALDEFVETIGIAFQIQDDVLNLTAGEEGKKDLGGEYGKEIGGDVSEGKITLMVIHALKNSPKKTRLKEILAMHTKNQALINEAIGIMAQSDSIKYAKQTAAKLVKNAWEKVEKILPENAGKAKLEAFADYLVERSY